MLIIDSATAFCTLFFGALIFVRWLRSKNRRLIDLNLAWSVFYFGLFANTIAFMISTYWIIDEPFRTHWITVAYITLILSLTAFLFAIEQILPYRTHNTLSVASLVCMFIILMVPSSLYVPIAVITSALTLVGILLFLRYSFDITSGEIRRDIKIVTFGFLVGWFGYVVGSDSFYYAFGETVYIIGLIQLLGGATVIGYVLTFTVTLDELDWEKQLVGAYLIQQGGLLIFHYGMDEDSDADEVLAAAGISGGQSLFQEITKTEEGFNIISIGEYELLFAHGSDMTGVLIARKSYRILLGKIKEFVVRFEEKFGSIIGRFTGSMNDFEPAMDLAESIFRRKPIRRG